MKMTAHNNLYAALAFSAVLVTGCSSTPTAEPEPITQTQTLESTEPEQAIIVPAPEPILAVHKKIVYFEFDSAELSQRSQAILSELINQVKQEGLSNSQIVIAGHTDATGPDLYNDELSQQRAKAVATFLKDNLDPSTWTVESFGEHQPVASNDDAAGREQNRRVVVEYVASNKPLALNK